MPKGPFKVTRGSLDTNLSYLGSEYYRSPNHQVPYISHQYVTSYPISKVHCHFFWKNAIETGRSRRGFSISSVFFWVRICKSPVRTCFKTLSLPMSTLPRTKFSFFFNNLFTLIRYPVCSSCHNLTKQTKCHTILMN